MPLAVEIAILVPLAVEMPKIRDLRRTHPIFDVADVTNRIFRPQTSKGGASPQDGPAAEGLLEDVRPTRPATAPQLRARPVRRASVLQRQVDAQARHRTIAKRNRPTSETQGTTRSVRGSPARRSPEEESLLHELLTGPHAVDLPWNRVPVSHEPFEEQRRCAEEAAATAKAISDAAAARKEKAELQVEAARDGAWSDEERRSSPAARVLLVLWEIALC